MKKFFSPLQSDKTLLGGFVGSLIILILHSLYLFFLFPKLPPFVPLYNQMPWGPERLGSQNETLYVLCMVSIIFVLNFIIALLIYSKMPLISRMISLITFIVNIFALLFIIRTIELIT